MDQEKSIAMSLVAGSTRMSWTSVKEVDPGASREAAKYYRRQV
jgi:hypothetical protein